MYKKILLILVFCGLTFFGYLYFISQKKGLPLLSPIWERDFTEKIAAKINSSLVLDFQKTKELVPLAKVPRYIVYNSLTGQVYYAKGTDQKISPASFTKLLSAQIALDFIPITEQITVSAESINKVPTILGLKAGESFIVEDLLRGAIATSANDAAQVLADE